jgi:hypothetical protein
MLEAAAGFLCYVIYVMYVGSSFKDARKLEGSTGGNRKAAPEDEGPGLGHESDGPKHNK